MVVEDAIKKYQNYLSKDCTCWDFGNEILYRMCREYPEHTQKDQIIGKVWLIGRSYSAAIERRKNAEEFRGDDFYFEVVAPSMIRIGKELDSRINTLNKSKNSIADDIKDVLETHKFLMKTFDEMTEMNKRSLASKYLHFHCPNKFFIYDSRARKAVGAIVKRPSKETLKKIGDYDEEYGDFVCRMIELQNELEKKQRTHISPREIDTFLLTEIK